MKAKTTPDSRLFQHHKATMHSQRVLANLVNEHLAKVTNHPEVYANLKAPSGPRRSTEGVSVGEGLSDSALGRLGRSLPRDLGPVAHVLS